MVKTRFRRSKRKFGRKSRRSASRRSGFKRMRMSAVKPKRSVRMGRGFPAKVVMTHKYVESFYLASPTLGSYAVYKHRANGMFDPNETGVGHQPMGFDQMAALYNHYNVIGSKIRYKFCRYGASGNSGAPIQIATYLDDDTTAPIDFNSLLEQNRVKSRVLGFNTLNGNSDNTYILTNRFSARKQFGTGSLAKTDLQGSPTSDPTELSHYVLAITSPTFDNQNVFVQVEIEYIAVWTEVKDITPS